MTTNACKREKVTHHATDCPWEHFCGECGAPMKQKYIKCPKGHDNIPGDHFCITCGDALPPHEDQK